MMYSVIFLSLIALAYCGSDYGPPRYDHHKGGYRPKGYKQYHGKPGYDYSKKGPECYSSKDCYKGFICSDGYCNPDCGPCAEYDFRTGYCYYQCAKHAKCAKRKYGHECYCPSCPLINGYDKYFNCRPPKGLKGLCYKAFKGPKYGGYDNHHGGYKYDKHHGGYGHDKHHGGYRYDKHHGGYRFDKHHGGYAHGKHYGGYGHGKFPYHYGPKKYPGGGCKGYKC